jgi:hypothetical protein
MCLTGTQRRRAGGVDGDCTNHKIAAVNIPFIAYPQYRPLFTRKDNDHE